MEAALSVPIEVITKVKGVATRTVKDKTFSKTLFIPQLFNRENLHLFTKFYPSQQKFAA